MIASFVAKSLSNARGVIGRFFLAPAWNRWNAVLNEVAFEALDLEPRDRVLEIGFGGGYLMRKCLKRIDGGSLAGLDRSATMARYCARRHRAHIRSGALRLHVGSAEALPFGCGAFTKVCTVNSIFYWRDPAAALGEIRRVLAKEGHLVLGLTCPEHLRKRRFARYGLRLFTAEEVTRMLEAAGFTTMNVARHADKHREFWIVTCA